jgi:pyrrolidone-carboxylate peptidase
MRTLASRRARVAPRSRVPMDRPRSNRALTPAEGGARPIARPHDSWHFVSRVTYTHIGVPLAASLSMLARQTLFALLGALSVSLGACAADPAGSNDEAVAGDDAEVKVDTRTPAARKQYDANVAFANGYAARCPKTTTGHPRVLLTGFGRFMSIEDNATGRIVSTVVPSARYPQTAPPPAGVVDPPAQQLSVSSTTLVLPGAGPVDVCAMILPVYWDLAAILIAKEMDAFEPTFVMMNGVAGDRQPIWVELGATNRAAPLDDGSNQLRPAVSGNDAYAKIVETASRDENARPNLLSWRAVESAAKSAIAKHADDVDQQTRLGDVLQGVKLAGFPRNSNTYLCNNVTYVTGYLMSHPRQPVRLLKASPAVRGRINEVKVEMKTDLRAVPRVFVHWPSEMATKHHQAGAEVMKAILDAQLVAIARGDVPTLGDNALADPSLQGGGFF